MHCSQNCCGADEPDDFGNIERQPDPLEDEEISAAVTGLTCARHRKWFCHDLFDKAKR